jgi:hypothetical protein
MPVDYSILQPTNIDIFGAAMRAQQLRASQENMRGLAEQRAALAEDRAAQTAERERATAVHTGVSSALQAGGGVREQTLAWATQNAPQSIPSLTEYFDKSAESAAKIKKAENDLNDARLDHLGHLADGVLAHGGTPEALSTALALYAEQFPKEAADVQKLGEQLKGASPEQIKGYLEQQRDASPYWQAKQAKNTPQVVAPGSTLVDDTGKPLYSAPAKEEHSPAYKEFQDAKAEGYKGTFEQYQTADANRRKSIVNVNAGNPTDVKETVAGMKDGTLPPQLPGRASKEYVALMAEAHRQGFDLATAATDWTATQKHIATMNGAQQLRLNQSVNALPEMLDKADELASKWKGGKLPLLNRGNLTAAKMGAFGKDAQSLANQLDSQIADVVADLGNVYMGGNSPTDHALSLAQKSLNADWSEKTFHDMIALAKNNVKIRQNSIKNTGVVGASENNPYGAQPAAPAAKPGGGFKVTEIK